MDTNKSRLLVNDLLKDTLGGSVAGWTAFRPGSQGDGYYTPIQEAYGVSYVLFFKTVERAQEWHAMKEAYAAEWIE